jgi:hypothetical protein
MNERGVRIGIGFFGLPRSTPWTLPSLEQHLIEPARSLGVVDERYHLYLQQRVVNARSGEDGALSPGHYTAFEAWSGELESADGVAEASGLARWSTYGDAYGDGFASLRNLLLQLHSLERLTLQFDADPPDLVVFVRPDLMLHDSLADDMREILARPVDTVRLPSWQWNGGYNDRYALCRREAFPVYGHRIRQVARFLDARGGPLHAERLLRFVLDAACVRVETTPVRASRVRVDGRVHREGFRDASVSRRVRASIRGLAKRVVLGR